MRLNEPQCKGVPVSNTHAVWLQLAKEGLTCGTRSEPDPDDPLHGGAASQQQHGGSPGGCSAADRSRTLSDRHVATPARCFVRKPL